MSRESERHGQADELANPVESAGEHDAKVAPRSGVALCLSGGGFRAMLFHSGALWRLNELGWLPRIDRISSVSGGSITAALAGLRWPRLHFDANGVSSSFKEEVIAPLRRFASQSIDVASILRGLFMPGSISDKLVASYERHLFREATLQDLPDRPEFVINATNMQSGALWRFSKQSMRDYRVGEVPKPDVRLSVAVAASSAFPPFLGPLRLHLDPSRFSPATTGEDLHREPYTREVVLCDGGVYDNLGLETAWKRFETVLISDAGGKMRPDPNPPGEWTGQSRRVLDLIDNQVRALRKRQAIGAFRVGAREGAYWGIRSDISHFALPDALDCPAAATIELAEIDTRLAKLPPVTQERLINWGYAVCDAAMRRHVDLSALPPRSFPYPEAGVG